MDVATDDPKTLQEALQRPDAEQWQQAYQAELRALEANQTWDVVRRTSVPTTAKIIGCKPVFKTKYTADGALDKHKVRIVAKGFQQRKGFDFEEVFAPVAHLQTVRRYCLPLLLTTCTLSMLMSTQLS